MPKFLFPDGAATDSGAYIVGQVIKDNDEPFDGSLYVDYRFVRDPEGFGTDWSAVSICHRAAEGVVYAAGGQGEIIRVADSGNTAELIAPDDNGPAVQGPIREIRAIGDDLYAVGMGRQVYRRSSDRRWPRVDSGILDLSGALTCGLTSITGDGHGFLTAVGYDGELWEFLHNWIQIDSPTNVLLNHVIPHDGSYYAAGVVGTMLRRTPAGWRLIDTGTFELDIWDLESFRGTLYIGTSQGLFQLSPDEQVEPVNPATFTRQVHCARLSAGRDGLWCFGADIVSFTQDGSNWREATIF